MQQTKLRNACATSRWCDLQGHVVVVVSSHFNYRKMHVEIHNQTILRRLLYNHRIWWISQTFFKSIGRVRVWDSVGWNGTAFHPVVLLFQSRWCQNLTDEREARQYFVSFLLFPRKNLPTSSITEAVECANFVSGFRGVCVCVCNVIPPWARARQNETSERLARDSTRSRLY